MLSMGLDGMGLKGMLGRTEMDPDVHGQHQQDGVRGMDYWVKAGPTIVSVLATIMRVLASMVRGCGHRGKRAGHHEAPGLGSIWAAWADSIACWRSACDR